MQPRSLRWRLLASMVLASIAAMTAASPARAEPSLSDRETARSLMDDGDAKRDKGDITAALKSYEAADAIMHVPTTALEVARAQVGLGLLLEARETLARMLRLPAKPNEPAPFTAARKTAETLGSDLGARIPAVTVEVSTDTPGEPRVVVFDGEVVPPAASHAPRKVNPGHHVIVVRAGGREEKQEVDVAERESKTVRFELAPVVVAAPLDAHDGSSHGPSSVPAILVYGGFALGAVGIGVGSVTGLMSIAKVSDVKGDCTGNVCPADRQGDLDSAKSLGTVSTVAFVVGGIGVGAGIVGLVLRSKAASTESAPGTSAALRVRPEIGPTWAGLRGTF
jgi:hypothetical protein